ncbi:MAG: glycosyltransferase [bacterium]
MTDELKDLFSKAGIDERVHWARVLTGRSMVDSYHAMDVFAFASKSETQGIVVAEAMAAGRRVRTGDDDLWVRSMNLTRKRAGRCMQSRFAGTMAFVCILDV